MQNRVRPTWSAKLAYAVGLLVTDGCLLADGRHIDLTSKDREQLENFLVCLGVKHRITTKRSGTGEKYLRVQFSDVAFYRFLLGIGLTPRKSKTIGPVKVPKVFFFDFLRGHFDGDGSFYSYFDPRWQNSFMFYTCFTSASRRHIMWLRKKLKLLLGISGHVTKAGNSSTYNLKYAKKESLELLKRLYYNKQAIFLTRKRRKVETALKIGAGGETVNTLP